MCVKSIYNARNELSSLVKLAESGEPVELTRRNKTVAVIIGYDEYRNSLARKPVEKKKSFIERSNEFFSKMSEEEKIQWCADTDEIQRGIDERRKKQLEEMPAYRKRIESLFVD